MQESSIRPNFLLRRSYDYFVYRIIRKRQSETLAGMLSDVCNRATAKLVFCFRRECPTVIGVSIFGEKPLTTILVGAERAAVQLGNLLSLTYILTNIVDDAN